MVDKSTLIDHSIGTSSIWKPATIASLEKLTKRIMRVKLSTDEWKPAVAGQHIDVRLTAEDGYQAQRSYSLLSTVEEIGSYEIAIEYLTDGEVSSYFHENAQVGDSVEVLGPNGGHFIWNSVNTSPVLLIGGGSGVVPLLSIVEEKTNSESSTPMSLLYGVRFLEDIIYHQHLNELTERHESLSVNFSLSRETTVPSLPQYHPGYIHESLIRQAQKHLTNNDPIECYVCGNNGFVESMTTLLQERGMDNIRTERFGE